MDRSEPRECPFCGGTDIRMYTEFRERKDYEGIFASCDGCGAYGPIDRARLDTREAAIGLWNTREKASGGIAYNGREYTCTCEMCGERLIVPERLDSKGNRTLDWFDFMELLRRQKWHLKGDCVLCFMCYIANDTAKSGDADERKTMPGTICPRCGNERDNTYVKSKSVYIEKYEYWAVYVTCGSCGLNYGTSFGADAFDRLE